MLKYGRITFLICILAVLFLTVLPGCNQTESDIPDEAATENDEQELKEKELPLDNGNGLNDEQIIEEELTEENEEKVLSQIERLRNDKLLKVLEMDKQEIINKFGVPDLEDWWAGPYLYYEDITSVIKENEDGATNQQYLLVWPGEGVSNRIAVDYLLGVESDMSFSEAKRILEIDADVQKDEGSEFGDYSMSVSIDEYNIIFYSDEGLDGAINSIIVYK